MSLFHKIIVYHNIQNHNYEKDTPYCRICDCKSHVRDTNVLMPLFKLRREYPILTLPEKLERFSVKRFFLCIK